MRTRVLIAMSLVLAAGACGRTERERARHERADAERRSEESRTAQEGTTGVTPEMTPASRAEKHIKGDFRTIEGQHLAGKTEFTQSPSGVMLAVEVENAPPGEHEVRLYQHADCSNIAKGSMGRPFAIGEEDRGETARERHHGDLGVIEVGEDGKGKLYTTLEHTNLTPGDRHSLSDHSVVILAHGLEEGHTHRLCAHERVTRDRAPARLHGARRQAALLPPALPCRRTTGRNPRELVPSTLGGTALGAGWGN